ncbi:GGDEF domain-containing protein [Paenibacillus physcomitrellae]|uniref:GGDEF domain-containing protein n=1 Tax=Paenibacillus physcomitrellae TaxID=1619311 RepID=UPI0012FE5493|nr:sensor domain-containing diguanylate cyclase [Paenibacillus physcomitrellae]
MISSRNPTKAVGLIGRKLGQFHFPQESKDFIYYLKLKPKPEIMFACPPLEKILGPERGRQAYKSPELLFSLLHPEDYERFISRFQEAADIGGPLVCRLRLQGDEYTWFEDYLSPVYKKGKMIAIQGILRNVQDKMEMQEQLKYRVAHDSMTGVHSREFFEEQLALLDQREDLSLTLVVCDMDNLKVINDTLGHKMGDAYIKSAAAMLKQFASEDVLISRIGGDEFSLLVLNRTREGGEALIRKMKETAAVTPGVAPGSFMSISIGHAYTERAYGQVEALFLEADRQMYASKQAKRKEEAKPGGSGHALGLLSGDWSKANQT